MKLVQNTDKNNYAELPAASLMRVVDTHQDLSAFGFRRPARYLLEPDHFYQCRAEMLSPRCIEHFQLACLFLRQIDKIKNFNHSASSYGLKHKVEDWANANPQGLIPYVANGMFIAAAYHCGFEVKPACPGGPNAFINFSTRSLKKLLPDPPRKRGRA